MPGCFSYIACQWPEFPKSPGSIISLSCCITITTKIILQNTFLPCFFCFFVFVFFYTFVLIQPHFITQTINFILRFDKVFFKISLHINFLYGIINLPFLKLSIIILNWISTSELKGDPIYRAGLALYWWQRLITLLLYCYKINTPLLPP